MRQATAGHLLTILTVLLATVGIQTVKAPDVLPENGPADRFSALRARQHLEAIAQEPRPLGTAQHERVRDYIVGELERLGLAPEVQETTSVLARRERPIVAASVANVMAVHEGREPGKAVLLVSHYDTTPTSPGAADDGSGVAAMLETLRALKIDSPLRNDVIFLFTDGEEPGLLGARAFMDRHPWASRVGVVLNLEARGTRGPGLMFETSEGNGRLIGEFRRAVGRPMATSYSYEIYKVLPNDTDFSIFKRAGLPGLNFAFIHGGTAYHSAQDSLENLDLRSLQHQGDSILGLARRLGDADLEGAWESGNAIYFNLVGPVFITYPEAWVLPMTGLLVLATVAFLVFGLRQRRFSVGGVLLGLLINLLGAAVLGGILVLAAQTAFDWSYNFTLWNDWSSTSLQLLALALVTAGITVAVCRVVSKKLTTGNLVGGGLLVWLILAVSLAVLAPGASYLFAIPLLLSLVAAVAWKRQPPGKAVAVVPFVLMAVAYGVTALLWAPTLALIGVALGGQAALLIGILVFLLLFGLLAPQLALATPRTRGWVFPAATVALGLVLLVSVRLASGFDSVNRRPNSILYAFDAENEEALWLSLDEAPDPWSSQFLSQAPERGMRPAFLGRPRQALMTSAPVALLSGAEVELLGEKSGPQTRNLELSVGWSWHVDRAILFLRSQGEIRAISIDGQRIERTENIGTGDAAYRMVLYYFAPPPGGIRLGVEMAGNEPLEVEAVGQRYALPKLAGFSNETRPAHLMPRADWSTDSTFVRNVTTLPPGAGGAAPEEALAAPGDEAKGGRPTPGRG